MPDWLLIAIKSFFAICMLFVITRVLGKKQISQLTFFEYIAGITLGELSGFISTDLESHYFLGVVALAVWFVVPLSVEFLTLKSKKLRDLVEGKGRVLIKEGKVLEDNLKKERLSSEELLEQLRTKSVFKLADVEFAVLEASGDLSVLLKTENQPLTPKHLGLKVGPERETQVVILDGEIQDEPLSTLGLNRGWLKTEMEKLGVTKDNVFIGQVDSYGEFYADLYDDKLKVASPQQKKLLYATLKKCEADLELFGLTTQDKLAKQMYENSAAKIKSIVDQLKPIFTTT